MEYEIYIHSGNNDILNTSHSIEAWKYHNCYKECPKCNECCSGGIFLGSFCFEAKDKGIQSFIKEVKKDES